MKNNITTIPAGEFKAKCLLLMEKAKNNHAVFVITKHGKPVAMLTPLTDDTKSPVYGQLKNSITIKKDIVKPIDEEWNADA